MKETIEKRIKEELIKRREAEKKLILNTDDKTVYYYEIEDADKKIGYLLRAFVEEIEKEI